MTFTLHTTQEHRTRIIAALRACAGGEGGDLEVTARKAGFMLAGAVSTK